MARLTFAAKVIETDGKLARGTYEASLNEYGLILARKGQVVFEGSSQTDFELLKKTSVRVRSPDQTFVFQVIKVTGYVDKIANAIVSSKKGATQKIVAGEYEFPKWLFAVALLPLVWIAVGGAIGGALGGVAAGINIGVARQEKWPLWVRASAMLCAAGLSLICYLAIAILLLGFGTKGNIGSNAAAIRLPSSQPESAVDSSSSMEKNAPPVPVAYKEFLEKGVVAISHGVASPLSACPDPISESVIVGYRDGSLASFSLQKSDQGWKLIMKFSGPVDGVHRLRSGHLMVRSSPSNFLVDPVGRVFRFPFRWVSVSHMGGLFAVHQKGLILGDLNFAALEEAAKGPPQDSSLSILEFPTTGIQSIGSLSGEKNPLRGNEDDIRCVGNGSVSVGYRDGKSEIWASGEWFQGDPRSSSVTIVGTRCGTGYADGVVDTGRIGPARYKQCGELAIVSLLEVQAWHIAINAAGEVWSWIPGSESPPQKIQWREEVGPVRAMVGLSSTTAVVAENGLFFYSSSNIGSLLK